MRSVRDYIVRHCKIVFPIIVIAAVAVTVAVALSAGKKKPAEAAETSAAVTEAEPMLQKAIPEVPLTANEDDAIYSLIATYYNAVALGDTETILNICDEMTDMELMRFQVTAQYIESYPALDIFTKPGPEQGSTIAYVYYKVLFQNQTAEFPGYQTLYICTNESGELYIKRGDNSEEENEYIKTVTAQADVVEFNNRITDEYNQLMLSQPELLEYLSDLDEQIGKEIGVILAQQSAGETGTEGNGEGQDPVGAENGGEAGTDADAQVPADVPAENTVQYAATTTTVNVRSSDSEQADKLGKASGGTKLEVLEQRVNGWTKVLFEGKEGYIKSEFLQAAESAEGSETIGSVTATTNINVRSAASETSEKLGIIAGGDSLELISKENGWCKVKFEGQIGYVKEEYVQ